jgi:hypothetical protein
MQHHAASNPVRSVFTHVFLFYSSCFIVKFHHLNNRPAKPFSRYVKMVHMVQVHFVLVAFNDLSKSFSFPCPLHCYRFIARFRISKLTQSYLRAASINSRSCYFEFIGKKNQQQWCERARQNLTCGDSRNNRNKL